jgi:hypothetical protein
MSDLNPNSSVYTVTYDSRLDERKSESYIDRILWFENDKNSIRVSVEKDSSWFISFHLTKSPESIEMYKKFQTTSDFPIRTKLLYQKNEFFTIEKPGNKRWLDEYIYLNIHDHLRLIDTICIQLDSKDITIDTCYPLEKFMNIISHYAKEFRVDQMEYIRQFLLNI